LEVSLGNFNPGLQELKTLGESKDTETGGDERLGRDRLLQGQSWTKRGWFWNPSLK
jgi:hypothetical protein